MTRGADFICRISESRNHFLLFWYLQEWFLDLFLNRDGDERPAV